MDDHPPLTLTANGKAYTLRPLGTNALCVLEIKMGKTFGALMGELGAFGMEQMRLSTVRVFLQSCMADDSGVTEEEIGALIDALGFGGIADAVNGLIVPARTVEA